MTVVVGTAGHVDHGKTALLQALTGIDADRLPEERRRGMTIDLGYAHMTLESGAVLDFVDVPGHDRLVGNMLVGAGEIDAALLVVAADEGVSAQTREHLGLLDALGIGDGLVALTKLDLLAPDDPRRATRRHEIEALLAATTLAGSPMVGVSSLTGEGLAELRAALDDLRRRVEGRARPVPLGARLAVDRAFTVRGRGIVVTGTLRGGPISGGEQMRVEPSGETARVREIQVHNLVVDHAVDGRVALNLGGIERDGLRRGSALCAGPAVRATERLVVSLRPTAGARPLHAGAELRLHLATDLVLGRLRAIVPVPGSDPVGVLVLARPIAAALDDHVVLRWPSPAETAAGGRVLDPLPARRLLRRRPDPDAAARLSMPATATGRLEALLAVHGTLAAQALASYAAALGIGAGSDLGALASGVPAGRLLLAPEIAAMLEGRVLEAVRTHSEAEPRSPGLPLATLRAQAAGVLQRGAALPTGDTVQAADAILTGLVEQGRLVRDGDALRTPGERPDLPAPVQAAMDRLVALLTSPAPPDLATASRVAGCPPEGLRALEAAGRIVRAAPDLAYAAETWTEMEALALRLAAAAPLSPAAFRDATGTSRKYALAILEELDARGLLRRGPDGHQLGPRAPRPPAATA